MQLQLVNRAALTVKLKQPYIEWANQFNHLGVQLSLERLPESRVYLIEDLSEYLVTKEDVLKRYYRDIFKHELYAWHPAEKDWPKKRDYATFLKWFEVEVHPMVVDIHQGSIETEAF